MSHIPFFKLGSLLIKTVTKPIAKGIKKKSKEHPTLARLCHSLGQMQHRLEMTARIKFQRGVSTFKVKNLPRDTAVENGADLCGEIFIFSVAAGLTAYEYSRSQVQKAESKAKLDAKLAAEKRDLEERLNRIEAQVINFQRYLETINTKGAASKNESIRSRHPP